MLPSLTISPLLAAFVSIWGYEIQSANQINFPVVKELTILGSPMKGSGFISNKVHIQPQTITPIQYNHGNPTPQEQLILELVNRARSNPTEEAARYGIDLNEGLSPDTISATPKRPLTFETHLLESSRIHSHNMIDFDYFAHEGLDGTNPGDRMGQAGYVFSGAFSWGENLGWTGSTGPIDPSKLVVDIHKNLFLSPHHRENIMQPVFEEVGISAIEGRFSYEGVDYNSVMVTQNFAKSDGSPRPFLLGIVYRDQDKNGFYTVGEGVAGVKIRPSRGSYYAVTSNSGGYAIPMPNLSGTVTLTFSEGGLESPIVKSVQADGGNVKLDLEILGEKGTALTLQFDPKTVRYQTYGAITCDLIGTVGHQFVLEWSSDAKNWVSTVTNTFASDRFNLQLPVNSNNRMGLYRTRLLP